MRFTPRLPCACAVYLAAFGICFADSFQKAPGYDLRIVPPYQNEGVGEGGELTGARYELSECRLRVTVIQLFGDSYNANDPQRTVTVFVPAALNLMNARVVNGLVVSGMHHAWAKCFAQRSNGPMGQQNFEGVRVHIVQRKELAVATGRTRLNVRDNTLAVRNISHHLADQIAAKEKAQFAAERQRQLEDEAAQRARLEEEQQRQREVDAEQRALAWAKGWQMITYIFWGVLAVTAFILAVRIISSLVTRIRWYFSPHPAFSHIKAATRRREPHKINGPALAEALGFKPRNKTEAILATRDIKKMQEQVADEAEYNEAKEALAQQVIAMELAKTRVETLARGRK